MVSYLFKDSNKAAFVNGINKLFQDSGIGKTLSSNEFVDNPEQGLEFSLYTPESDEENEIINKAVKDNYFSFQIKKININQIIKEIVEKRK